LAPFALGKARKRPRTKRMAVPILIPSSNAFGRPWKYPEAPAGKPALSKAVVIQMLAACDLAART
jgi:hypothetical protein